MLLIRYSETTGRWRGEAMHQRSRSESHARIWVEAVYRVRLNRMVSYVC